MATLKDLLDEQERQKQLLAMMAMGGDERALGNYPPPPAQQPSQGNYSDMFDPSIPLPPARQYAGNTLADIARNPDPNWSQETKDALARRADLSGTLRVSHNGNDVSDLFGGSGNQPQQPTFRNTLQVGNNAPVDLGQSQPAGLAADWARPVDVMGAKGHWASDNSGRIILRDGRIVDPGRDTSAERVRTKENLANDSTRANIAHTQATTNKTIADTANLPKRVTPEEAAAIKRKEATYNAGLKEVSKDEAAVVSAGEVEKAYERWKELNAKVTTGPIAGRRPMSWNPDYQELLKIENFLAMNNFKPGQGSMSNVERAYIKGSGPNTVNNEEANTDIANIGIGAAKSTKDKANFRDTYLQTKGTTIGSDKAWQDYLDENPRYKTDPATNRMVENTDRVDWQDYFSGNKEKKVSSTGKHVPVSSDEDRSKLKSGTIYIAPDGTTRVKK